MTSDWQSWVRHGLIALALLPLFILGLRVLPRWAQPAVYATGYVLYREVEQAISGGIAPDRWADGVFDVLIPAAATLLLCRLAWVGGLRW